MKAAWLKDLALELDNIRTDQQTVERIFVHCKVGDEWRIEEGASLGRDLLERALADSAPIKVGRQRRYLFGLAGDAIVVDVEFTVFLKAPGRDQARRAIDKARDHTRHRFDAHHDPLTGSKNRKSFDGAIRDAVASVPAVAASAAPVLGDELSNSVSLVSLDIDFFKRVNDSRGHDYGDLVLRSFAWLIEDLCEKANQEFTDAKFTFFRLGGEEFNILAAGKIGKSELLEWVEDVRSTVEQSFIPSDGQLEIMRRDTGLLSSVPPQADRRITASFGVARAFGPFGQGDHAQIISRLKTHADKALYSAKSGGRNRVRYFPDILNRFGRVIENDKSAGIIAIDIGAEVGVVRGREFFVVPERYTGETHYIIDDGRTQRRLGKYPRLRIAKIVAFEVQDEISFCSVTEHLSGTEVVPGSLLESIPLGLFGGLMFPHEMSVGSGESDGRASLNKMLTQMDESVRRVVALRFGSLQDVDKTHGQAKANELLAAASAALSRVLPAPIKVEQVEIGQFGVVFSAADADVMQKLEELVNSMRPICGDLVDFSVGLFDKPALRDLEGTSFSVSWDNSYDYAVIAAAAVGSGAFGRFNFHSPDAVLAQYSDSGEHEQVIADYSRFASIGLISADILNRAGIALFVSGNAKEANSEFRAAIELDPADPSIRDNYGLTQFVLKNYQDAYEQLREGSRLRDGHFPRRTLLGVYAKAAYESSRTNGSPSAEAVRDLLVAALAETRTLFVKREELETIRQYLDQPA